MLSCVCIPAGPLTLAVLTDAAGELAEARVICEGEARFRSLPDPEPYTRSS